MFNQFVSPRSSSCVEDIAVDLLNAKCDVLYKNGENYRYENVSRRALLNLLLNKNLSLGFWINENLLPYYKNVICLSHAM